MQVGQGGGNDLCRPSSLPPRRRHRGVQPVVQVPVSQLVDQHERMAEAMECDHVGVLHVPERLDLPQETGLIQHLHRPGSIIQGCFVDLVVVLVL